MSNPIFFFFLSFVGGIIFHSLSDFGGVPFSLFIICLGAAIGTLIFFYSPEKLFKVIAIIVVAFGLGMLRADVALAHGASPILDSFVGNAVVLYGFVSDESDVRESHTKLTFRVDHVARGYEEYDVETKALLVVEHYPEFQYGDRIIVRGVLRKPENFQEDLDSPGRPFDYVSYLAKDGIYYQIFYPKIEFLAGGAGNRVRHFLFSFKHDLLQNIGDVIPEPHSSLLGGIILGAKRALGEELLDEFRKTGIIHIVVLSGYNITIIADAIGRIASFLPRTLSIALSVGGIAAFVLMTGAGATVVRAGIMALLILLARATGRVYEAGIALFAAAFFMVLWNPEIVLFDPSFELSFLATVGLIYVAPRLERFMGFLPTRFHIREFGTATVATQIFVLPALIYMTGMLSVVSFLANILVLPVVPVTMFLGLVTAFSGFFHTIVSLPLAYMEYIFLEYMFRVAEWLSSFPWSAVTISEVPLWAVILFYCLCGIAIFLRKNSKNHA